MSAGPPQGARPLGGERRAASLREAHPGGDAADPVLAVAVRAARRAASVVVDASRDLRRLPTFSQEHAEIVNGAGREAEGAIVATLSAAFPEHGILAAASGEMRAGDATSPLRWIVEPIDGRLNFAHGFPYYATAIALADGNDVTHAVVLDPAHDELFTAVKGKGALRNGAPMSVSACTRLSEALVATVFPTRKSAKLPAYLPVFNALIAQCAGLRRAGACALDMAHLAAGRLDGFWVTSLRALDIAAGSLLIAEAGGRLGDFAGGPEYLRTNEVIAAATGLFNPLREAIAAAPRA